MVGEDGRLVVQPVGVELLDGAADRAMEVPAPLREQALVGRVLDHRVLEDVFRLGKEARLVDELQSLQRHEVVLDLLRDLGDPPQDVQPELPADGGRGLHGALDRIIETVQPRANDVVDSAGKLDLSAPGPDEAAVLSHQETPFPERGDDLLDEQRVPLGLVLDAPDQIRRHGAGTEQGADHPLHVGLAEEVEADLAVVRLVRPGNDVARTKGRQRQHAKSGEAVDQRGEVLLGRLVDPLHVLDDEDVRPALAAREGERADRLEGLLPLVLRVQVSERGLRARQAPELAEKGQGGRARRRGAGGSREACPRSGGGCRLPRSRSSRS
jgi:hypothetical protein